MLGRLQSMVATYFKQGSKKGQRVFVTEHVRTVDGQTSNWVHFRFIKPDGTLGRLGGDYDLGKNFRHPKTAQINILNVA